jgi:hypothetical protein
MSRIRSTVRMEIKRKILGPKYCFKQRISFLYKNETPAWPTVTFSPYMPQKMLLRVRRRSSPHIYHSATEKPSAHPYNTFKPQSNIIKYLPREAKNFLQISYFPHACLYAAHSHTCSVKLWDLRTSWLSIFSTHFFFTSELSISNNCLKYPNCKTPPRKKKTLTCEPYRCFHC